MDRDTALAVVLDDVPVNEGLAVGRIAKRGGGIVLGFHQVEGTRASVEAVEPHHRPDRSIFQGRAMRTRTLITVVVVLVDRADTLDVAVVAAVFPPVIAPQSCR